MNRRCGSSKPTPTPQRPGYEARKNAKKVIEGIEDTIRRQSTVKTLPCVVNVAGGGETKKSELKENTGAKTRETKVKILPQAAIVAGGGETKGENQHEMERWHHP